MNRQPSPAPAGHPRRPGQASIALGLAVLVGGMFLLLRPIADPDIWFHLVVGREVFLRAAIPAAEFYVFPLAGQPGAFHEWGFGLIYFLVEKYWGTAGMSLLNGAVSAAIATALYGAAVARLGHRNRLWAGAAAVSAALLMEFRLVYRPETFLYLALALELAVLEIYLARRDARILLALPAIAFVLAQCHPSPLFLLAVVAAYILQTALAGGTGYRQAIALGLAGLASALAATLNPYGVEQLLLPLKFQSSAELLDSLVEFLPAWKTPYRAHVLLETLLALVAGAYALRRRRTADGLLLLLFGILAWRYARNVALFALVLALPLASAMAEFLSGRSRRQAAGLALPVLLWVLAVRPAGPAEWGVGVDRKLIPELAAGEMAAHHPNGRVANFFHLGNYLAWASPTTQVLVDGRNFSHNRAVDLHDRIMRADPGWETLIRELGVDVIVTPATLPYSGQLVPLVAELERHPAWQLAIREPAALTFVRAGAGGAASLPAGEIWQQVLAEIAVTLQDNPGAEGAPTALALANRKLGR